MKSRYVSPFKAHNTTLYSRLLRQILQLPTKQMSALRSTHFFLIIKKQTVADLKIRTKTQTDDKIL